MMNSKFGQSMMTTTSRRCLVRSRLKVEGEKYSMLKNYHGTNISHLENRKIMFKTPLGDILVARRVFPNLPMKGTLGKDSAILKHLL